jgi:hypothetical protein
MTCYLEGALLKAKKLIKAKPFGAKLLTLLEQ